MKRYGVPASVILAQGIIESADGKSTLAQTANNHFGIKGTYNGSYILANDDKPNEMFKKYDDVGQSFEDHSKILMLDRYRKFAQGLAPNDYEGWTDAIRKGGYATSSAYDRTIISVIEGCNLQKYDQMVMDQVAKEGIQIGTQRFLTEDAPLLAISTSSASQTEKPNAQCEYSLPVKRNEFMLVTSPFGNRPDPMDKNKMQFHKGIDINCKNEPLLATENNGKVVALNQDSSSAGGKSITIEYQREDGCRYQTTYMHLSNIELKLGDIVNAGQKIGISGQTGTRSTGPHLHFEVRCISPDGTKRAIDPAAYIAEICQKGGLSHQLLYNGKDLLASYKDIIPENRAEKSESQPLDSTLSPEEWMKKILSSEDSGMGMNINSDPFVEIAMSLFSSLLALAIQIDNKDEEEKMQAVTDAACKREIDLVNLLPSYQQCSLSMDERGMVLHVNDGISDIVHPLTTDELSRIQHSLYSSKQSDEEKRKTVANVINGIVVSEQMSKYYEQSLEEQVNRQEYIQRK